MSAFRHSWPLLTRFYSIIPRGGVAVGLSSKLSNELGNPEDAATNAIGRVSLLMTRADGQTQIDRMHVPRCSQPLPDASRLVFLPSDDRCPKPDAMLKISPSENGSV